VIDLDARALVSSLDAISRAELREALSDKKLLEENRAARNAAIAEAARVYYGEFSARTAAARIAAELLQYANVGWCTDFARKGCAPQASERRKRMFLILRLSGGRPTGMRTIQEIIGRSWNYSKNECAKPPLEIAHVKQEDDNHERKTKPSINPDRFGQEGRSGKNFGARAGRGGA
jgi:hypothetical protein